MNKLKMKDLFGYKVSSSTEMDDSLEMEYGGHEDGQNGLLSHPRGIINQSNYLFIQVHQLQTKFSYIQKNILWVLSFLFVSDLKNLHVKSSKWTFLPIFTSPLNINTYYMQIDIYFRLIIGTALTTQRFIIRIFTCLHLQLIKIRQVVTVDIY